MSCFGKFSPEYGSQDEPGRFSGASHRLSEVGWHCLYGRWLPRQQQLRTTTGHPGCGHRHCSTDEQLEQLFVLLGNDYYISPEAARDALRRRSMFNIIDFTEGWKADLIIRKDRPFSIEEFRRRQMRSLFGRPTPIASAEDVILSKLEWNKMTPSDRQLKDVFQVVMTQGPLLDLTYLRKWAAVLGVQTALEELFQKAEELKRAPESPTKE